MQTTLSTNASTEWYTAHEGHVFVQAAGTWGSGTLTVEVRLEDGSTVQALEEGAFTSGPISKHVTVPRGIPIRLKLSGSSGASIVTQVTTSSI